MEVNTIGDLKKLINNHDDDFRIEMNIMTEISEEQLKGSLYPYPYIHEKARLEYHDTGYSDKVVCFGVYKD